MKARFTERQYLPPAVYVVWALVVGALFIGMLYGLWFHSFLSAAAAGAALGLLLLAAALAGRMVTAVDDTSLTVSFGWLGVWRRKFDLGTVERVCVCLYSSPLPYLGRGYCHSGPAGPHLSHRGRRGVRIKSGPKRWFIGSSAPLALKTVLLSGEAADGNSAPQADWIAPRQRHRDLYERPVSLQL